ncbi:2-oxo-3-hexenedioate decarboxylase [Pseudoxanthomonas yeongjuensis]|uniref:2-oxo-3-hexenedioate decarboxylase n=1 Tax=Pseudoxanthomonas yeongjuensis TaxID=377616 RepID=UPI001391EEE2|nr:2-oxo-3-hexenedioate decarboxylase [Pseudoxanthomonas yeongjuensis]KAF1716208.1 2-oxo-3-hexenedioate decarboxylase [Pseudoxanthomonas yeongjuensis]
MTLEQNVVEQCAQLLYAAEQEVREVPRITDDHPQMNVADAYRIQERLRELKQAQGLRIVGMKMGLTSHAKMQQMGVDTPIYGFLAEDNAVPDGGVVEVKHLIHPKVEAEIAFVMREPLSGPDCDAAKVLAATDFVLAAIELIDSRYENFRFDLPSVIADNTSASRYVLGSRATAVAGLDLETLGVVLERNGQVVEVGAGAAVLGNPAQAVAMLVNMLAARGQTLPAGSVVLSGAITAAIPVAAGDNVQVRADGIGTVSMRFV